MSAQRELHHLEQAADDGDSAATPLTLLRVDVLFWVAAVLVLTAVGLLAYRLGT